MGKLIVVENDKVEGTDKHNVSGFAPNPAVPPVPPEIAYVGVADFDYAGKMTDELSDFVTIGGSPVALVSSKSSLDPGEDAPPSGKHLGMNGKAFVQIPPMPPPTVDLRLAITDPIGEGKPSAGTGSSFFTVGGVAALLDGDAIDTCDGLGVPMNSTVTAENQDFVSASA